MIQYGFLAFACVCCLFAIQDWRLGIWLTFLVGVLQDPARKATPGFPAFLTLSLVPVCVCSFIGLMRTVRVFEPLQKQYPSLLLAMQWFALSLMISTLQTMSYGLSALPLSLLGLFSYLGGLPAFFLGYYYVRQSFDEANRVFFALVGLTAIMLVGVLLEYYRFKFQLPLLGMMNPMRGDNRRWYSRTEWVEMLCGFYRAPEVMGWHAAIMTILSIYYLVRLPRYIVLWIGLIAWGFIGVLLSGRRKMFLMIFVFLASFAVLSEGKVKRRVLTLVLFACVPLAFMVATGVDERYLEAAGTGFAAAGTRVTTHTVLGPLMFFTDVGLFGYGVGVKTQGAQHLNVAVPRSPLLEGGFEKVLVELGVVGTSLLIVVLIQVALAALAAYRRARAAGLDLLPLHGWSGLILANVSAFAIAFQIYGDPMVVIFIGFIGGLLLSGPRVGAERLRAKAVERDRVARSNLPLPQPIGRV